MIQLRSEYIQKSRVFLYPALDIVRGAQLVPFQTYMSFDKYNLNDCRLICVYRFQKSNRFSKVFAKEVLLKHKLFEGKYQLIDDSQVYIFNLSEYKSDYELVIEGKYSKLSTDFKSKILSFYSDNFVNQVEMNSYLFPLKYVEKYAELLKIDSQILNEVGELYSKPDLECEHLTVSKKSLSLKSLLTF